VVVVSAGTPLVARCGILLVLGVSNCNKRGRWYGEGDHDQDGVTTAVRCLMEDDIMMVVLLVVV
jgi:hypothetical protein